MLIYLVLGLWSNWPAGGSNPGNPNYTGRAMGPLGGTLLLFLLLLVLGWAVFGKPVHG